MKLFWAFAIVAIALMAFAIYLSMFSRMEVQEDAIQQQEERAQEVPDNVAAWALPVTRSA